MFLKFLSIVSGGGVEIRKIQFHKGLNLIVDDTPADTATETGNNVGKTTVLKLIDFCLGASGKAVYLDAENRQNEHKTVKDFLVDQRVLISLVLKDDLAQPESREVLIERNFAHRKEKIQRINGEPKTDEDFERALTELLYPGHFGRKPTFRQIVAHNIRYQDQSINNTLKNLDAFTRDDEYETLYLFLLGCDFAQGDEKQNLRAEIQIEENFKRRLESVQTKAGYQAALGIIDEEIKQLEARKTEFNINPRFQEDLDKLNDVKYRLNVVSAEVTRLVIRRDLILEAEKELRAGSATIDMQQLRQVYSQATALVGGIQKTFEELTAFHNTMVESKVRFIMKDLPALEEQIGHKRGQLEQLLSEEAALGQGMAESASFKELEVMIGALNSQYQKKGEYESVLKQLGEVESKLADLNKRLAEIDDNLFSETFSQQVQDQVNKFNKYFSSVSNELYGEKYALKVETKLWRGRRLYEFSAFNLNFSSGKKQGEIVCFDIAYTLFADAEGIPCMHFLLNDKKELMHGNQLLTVAQLAEAKGIQFVVSILRDKLPAALNEPEFVILTLSQRDKLFRIESGGAEPAGTPSAQ